MNIKVIVVFIKSFDSCDIWCIYNDFIDLFDCFNYFVFFFFVKNWWIFVLCDFCIGVNVYIKDVVYCFGLLQCVCVIKVYYIEIIIGLNVDLFMVFFIMMIKIVVFYFGV